MLVSEQAVQAAFEAYGDRYRSIAAMQDALTAALPFLTGVKVKALEWGNARITDDGREAEDAESPVGRYIATDTGWFLLGQTGYEVERGLHQAKAAAQADYSARILPAIEVLGNSEQLAPSPRAQALDEAVKFLMDRLDDFERAISGGDDDLERHYTGHVHPAKARLFSALSQGTSSERAQVLEEARAIVDKYDALVKNSKYRQAKIHLEVNGLSFIRALSSQPVADGWLPIETAPKDGSFIDLWHVNNTRVPKCRWFTNSSGYTAWHVQQGGRACNMGGDQMFTHWRPLPASPGASE